VRLTARMACYAREPNAALTILMAAASALKRQSGATGPKVSSLGRVRKQTSNLEDRHSVRWCNSTRRGTLSAALPAFSASGHAQPIAVKPGRA